MRSVSSISGLPNCPAVYALYSGAPRARYVAYVGIADKLRQRITQHLMRRDSSVTTGVAAVSLNPDLVIEVRWWEHPTFADSTRLEAAELVAFDVLEPALRSRGAIRAPARELAGESAFRQEMRKLFAAEAVGQLIIPTFQDALERIAELERRLAAVEAKLGDRS
jgi:hypothetical protein